jgi:competence protein ComEC
MFILGKALTRDISYFNILALAALVMLIYDPLLLFNVSFQLSFSAVGGIVYFQPIIYKWLSIPNKILDWPLKILSVTIAAQVTTLPITLFYFHQFPTYFWITNILLIVLISIDVVTLLIFLLTNWIPYFNKIMLLLTENSLKITNKWISIVEALPGAVIENIRFSAEQILFYFILLLLITNWLKHRNNKQLISITITLIIAISVNLIEQIKKQDKQLIVYNLPKVNAFGLYDNERYLLLYDADSLQFSKIKNSYFKNHWIEKNLIKSVELINIPKLNQQIRTTQLNTINKIIIRNGEHNILSILPAIPNKQLNDTTFSDYYFIYENDIPTSINLLTKNIILGKTLNYKARSYWNNYAIENKLHIIDMKNCGIFTIPLE